jgi:hypothetical protein
VGENMSSQDILGIIEVIVICSLFMSGIVYYYYLFKFFGSAKAKDIVLWSDVRNSFVGTRISDFSVGYKLLSKKEFSGRLKNLGYPITSYASLARIWLRVALSILAVVLGAGLYLYVKK